MDGVSWCVSECRNESVGRCAVEARRIIEWLNVRLDDRHGRMYYVGVFGSMLCAPGQPDCAKVRVSGQCVVMW